ncbi:hypothetical protein D3C73_890820 [compost metagenome]
MRGGHHPAFCPVNILQYRNRQRRAFRRISTGTHFIEQNKTFGSHPLQNGNSISHMTGEGTEALLNALFISDIGINRVKYAQLTAFLRRNE